jgi:hypothetical protein
MENVVLKEVLTKKDKQTFIFLPEKIHRSDTGWLPPVYLDERKFFDEKKNISFRYAETVRYLAYRDNKPVGRIMGIISHRYNGIRNEKHGRFCFLESFADQEVVHALITKVEEWAREKGMIKLVGPFAFSDKDPQGFQVEGFECPKFIFSPANAPFLPEMIIVEGYTKYHDLVNYVAKIKPDIPVIYKSVLERISHNSVYRIVEFKSKKEIRPYFAPILDLLNQAFSEIYGFVPLNDDEKKDFISRYMMLIDPRFIKVVETNDGLVGFAIGMRDMSEGVRKSGGRIFPFGFLRIIDGFRNSKKLLLLLGGIKKDYRGRGIDVLMGIKMLQSCKNHNLELMDFHLVLEDNYPMRGECERIGGRVVKRFRIYSKDLR